MKRARSNLRKLGMGAVATAFLCVCSLADLKVAPAVDALLVAHNRERKQEKLGPLKLSPKLCESAAIHARDMAGHEKLDHTGSDGSTVVDRVKRVGYIYVRVGENIANGQKTVNQVMDTWMKSPGHRANILADFTEMGAARVEDDEGMNYWCVNFGIPMPRLNPDEAAAAVAKEINRDREAGRKVLLKPESKLGRAAMALSAAMAAKDSLEIDGDPFKLVDEKALQGRDILLQLSANVPTPEQAAAELKGEEAAQLDSFREIGVGYAQAKSGTPYWCAIFAKPAGSQAPGQAQVRRRRFMAHGPLPMSSRTSDKEEAGPTGSSSESVDANQLSRLSFLFLAAWCGLAAGLLEVGAIVLRKSFFDWNHLYWMSRHFIWLVPITNLLIFLVVGGALSIMIRSRRQWAARFATRILGTLSLLPLVWAAFPRIHAAAGLFLALGAACAWPPFSSGMPRAFADLSGSASRWSPPPY